jgi:hypothetical protein
VEEDELNSPDMDFLEMDFDPAADSVGGHDFDDDDDEDDHNRRQEDVRRNMHGNCSVNRLFSRNVTD